MSDLGSPKRLSVDVDLTGYPVSPGAAPVRPVTGDEPPGLWLDGDGNVTADPGRAVAPSARRPTQPEVTRSAEGHRELPRVAEAVSVRTNTLAVLAFVFSLFGSALLAVILGHVALTQIRATGEKGHGLAMAGTIIGYLSTAVVVVILIAGAVTAATAQSL